MRIQHNIMAMNAYRNYTNNVSAMKKNLEKLSSGYKINRAGDDAAGLAISEKMRAQITGLQTAQKNAKDGISLVQTAEGALTEVHDMLNRMVELATQSANGTYDNTDRTQLQKEVNQLLEEIDRIADSSNFNGINLLDGTLGLNTEAFTVGESKAYVAAVDPQDVELQITKASHGGESAKQIMPSFEINLGGLKLDVASGVTDGKIQLKIGDAVATLATGVKTADATKYDTAAEIAGAIVTKWGGAAVGATATKALQIGDLYYKAEAVGSTGVKFTAIGNALGNGANAANIATSPVLTTAQVTAANTMLKGAAVEIAVDGTKVLVKEDFADHNIFKATPAQEAKPGERAGANLTINEDLVQNGNTLTIGTTVYTFKVGSGATGTGNDIVIDTKKFDTASKQVAEAHRQLAKGIVGDFVLTAKTGNVIHIEEKAGLTDPNKYITGDDIIAKVSAKDAGAAAKPASTQLTVTGKAKEGNVLNIGTDTIKFDGGEDADAIKTAIEAKGYTVESAAGTGDNAGKTFLTIYAKTAGKDEEGNAITIDAKDTVGPRILGKGLTLQIGDTSDDFNQLNVAVQDMHAVSLGLKDLKINTEESAQAAIQTIKNAINTVSDVRGTLGATQNRLDHTINNLSVMTENIQDAESTIRDTDVAEEMMAYTKNNILIQSAQAMLAQANQVPQGVLQLLG